MIDLILGLIASDYFGYLGSAMVLVSMLMNSMRWMRILNMSGSIISLIYALVTNSWPFVLLNGGLVLIHIVKLYMLKNKENKE